MGKSYRPYLPEQDFLLPPSLRDWLPENHLAYFVSDVVDHLDLSAIESVYEKDWRGQPPYHPRLMTKLLVYGYAVGVRSSRRIAKALVEDVAFRVLAAGNEPDFRTLSDFRKIHLKALEQLFSQVLRIALEAGAMRLGRVALDGTKVKANASKHKAMSYGRIKEAEQKIEQEVKQILAEAEALDAADDARYGSGHSGEELPAELQQRQTRLHKIREAKQALEQRAREKAAAEGQPAEQVEQATPQDKDQYNFTDSESRILKGADGFVQGFNAQAAVEPDMQLIVGQTLTQAANDKEQLQPLLEAVEQQAGQRPTEVLADSGYCSEKNLASLESAEQPQNKIEAYIATGRQKHGQPVEPAKRGPLPQGATHVEKMKRRLQTKAGKKIYAQRKAIVEPVFGQIKHCRGIRQFLLRGLEKVRGEWAIVCLTHNILKMHRVCYG
jgi:transposase